MRLLKERYEYITLFFLTVVMLSKRVQNLSEYLTPTKVYFRGTDSYYHLRNVQYTVQHYPQTLGYDPFTNAPHGKIAGQFGTLFDQLVATAALVVGFGNPSEYTIRLVLVFSPVAFGILTLFPVYGLSKELTNKPAALLGCFVLAIQPGIFLQRSLLGMSDHNIAEVFFMALAAYTFVLAFRRNTLFWKVFAGISLSLYMLVWPPGILLAGIFGLGFLLIIVYNGFYGHDSADTVFTFAIVTTTTVSILILNVSPTLSVTSLSLLHVAVPVQFFLIGMFMWTIQPHFSKHAFLGITGFFGLVTPILAYLIEPQLTQQYVGYARRFVFFGATETSVGEAQSTLAVASDVGMSVSQLLFTMYGVSIFTALIGLVLLLRSTEGVETKIIFLVWSGVITCASLTQLRFNYYLVLPVSILNAILFYNLLETFKGVSNGKFAILSVLLLVSGSLAIPYATADYSNGTEEIKQWEPTLEYLETKTEPPSVDYSNPSQDSIPSYSILTWWDYGHWITVESERAVVSNPFQDNIRDVSQVLFSTPENERKHFERVETENQSVRYIVVSKAMVAENEKLDGIATAHPTVSYSDLYRNNTYTSRYDESLMVRLYFGNVNGYELVFSQNGVKVFKRS